MKIEKDYIETFIL